MLDILLSLATQALAADYEHVYPVERYSRVLRDAWLAPHLIGKPVNVYWFSALHTI